MNIPLRKFSKEFLCCVSLLSAATVFIQAIASSEVANASDAESFMTGSISEFQYAHGGRDIRGFKTADEQKPALLLIHGSPGGYDQFKQISSDNRITEKFQIIVVDRPGYGGSGKGEVEKSLGKQAALIKPALHNNKSGKPAIVVGYSFGGAVATRLALDFPESVGTLLLLAPTLDPDLESPRWYERLGKTFKWILSTELRVYIDESYDLANELRAMMPLYPKIRARVYYIHGDKDSVVSPKTLEFAKRRFDASRFTFQTVSGMDHYIPQENAELTIDAILKLHSQN